MQQQRDWMLAQINCEKIAEDIQLTLPDFIVDDLWYIAPIQRLLTNNEWYVLNRIIKGWTYRQISEETHICRMTISKVYRNSIRKIAKKLKEDGISDLEYSRRPNVDGRPLDCLNQGNPGATPPK